MARKTAGNSSNHGRTLHLVGAVLDQRAPRRHGLLNPQTEEAEERFHEDDLGDGQRHVDGHHAQQVRNDVPANHRESPHPLSLGRLDEFAVLEAEGLAADDPRHVQPDDGAQGDEDQEQVAPEKHHEQDHEEHEGHGVEDVHDAHHQVVQPAAEIARDGAVADADEQADQRRRQAHHQRDAPAVERADEEVPAQRVGAEQVAGLQAGADGQVAPVGEVVAVGAEPGADDDQHAHDADDDAGDHRGAVLAQRPPGVHPQAAARDLLLPLDGLRNGAHEYFTLGSSQA